MLTSDLLRIEVAGNEVKPLYISRKEAGKYLDIAERMLSIFRSGIGTPRSALHAALQHIEQEANFKVVRGLTKLVEDECVYTPAVDTDYAALRAEVFARAQERYPLVTTTDLLHSIHRDDEVAAIAATWGYSRARLEELLFADLPPYHVLREVCTAFTPESLLQRYNLALAQALLYRALSMTVTLKGDFSLVWKYVKLAQLIHEIEKCDDNYTFSPHRSGIGVSADTALRHSHGSVAALIVTRKRICDGGYHCLQRCGAFFPARPHVRTPQSLSRRVKGVR